MGTWSKGSIEIVCEHCDAEHTADYQNLPVRERGSFNCLKCGKQAFKWNGGIDYSNWKLK